MMFDKLSLLGAVVALLQSANAKTAPRASNGCGTVHDFVGESREFSFESDLGGGTRSYRTYLPTGYDANSPQPLLITFHGAGGVMSGIQSQSHFSDEDVNPDMVTVYPAGINGTWQGPTYAIPDINDEQFTTDLVTRIKDRYCIDESRIYAAGYSNGGGFVSLLACSADHGGQFAAFASVAGAMYTDVSGNDGCNPSRSPLPILESHGTGDPTVPYEGGEGRGGPLPDIPEWLSRWADRNECSSSSTQDLGNGVTDESWSCAAGDGLVRHLRIQGHDHGFPGPDNPQVYLAPHVMEFLKQFSKP